MKGYTINRHIGEAIAFFAKSHFVLSQLYDSDKDRGFAQSIVFVTCDGIAC
jgi:hypothetical protein